MSADLLVLCAAAFSLVAVLVSGLVGMTLSGLDRLSGLLPPRHRARLWLWLAASPVIAAGLAILVALFPALGIGLDHCVVHGSHHPHLCPHHGSSPPGVPLLLLALLLGARLLQVFAAFARALFLSQGTSHGLVQASDAYADALIFPCDEPQAFVLGALRSRVHVSRGLLALGRDIVEPVLAHERVHAARRDLLWRALCPVIAAGHFPAVVRALRERLCAAQELAADAEAAETLSDGRLKMAEALLRLARVSRVPAPGISITHGDVKTRVHALLEGRTPPYRARWTRGLVVFALSLLPVVGALHDPIHHGLETLLGALS